MRRSLTEPTSKRYACIEFIEDTGKLRSDNTSGCRGLKLVRDKWQVRIGFQKRSYFLGSYADKEEAIRMRRQAEDAVYGDFLDWYAERFPEKNTRKQKAQEAKTADNARKRRAEKVARQPFRGTVDTARASKDMGTVKRVEPGARFGHLICEQKSALGSTGGSIWRCLCKCGREIEASEAMLLSGVIRSCGCRNNRTKNLRGERFGQLTALEPTPEKDADGSVKWLCRCDCGNYKVLSSNKLRMGHTTSCGCIACRPAQEAKIYVDGTCVNQMLSEKVSRNNTSGYRGVSKAGKRWQAYICYAGKARFLGKFATKEEAAEARRKAFEKIQEHLNRLLAETADAAEGAQNGEQPPENTQNGAAWE